jgi:hypothetical protein
MPVEKGRIRAHVELVAARRVGAENHDEPRRIGEGERPQQHSVDDTEDRAVGADAERERADRDRGEARVPAQRAERVDEILLERINELDAAPVAIPLLRRFHAAEREHRLSPLEGRISMGMQ